MKWYTRLFNICDSLHVTASQPHWTTTKTTFQSPDDMSTIMINGKSYTGKNVSIINGKVTIDGVKQDGDALMGIVKVEITGDPASIDTDAPVVVNGNVRGNVIADGPVTCGNVNGDVDADGPCTCHDVKGNVTADGPVTCGPVGGNVVANMVMHS